MRLVVFDDHRVGVLIGDSVRDVSSAIPGWVSGDIYAMNRLIANWSSSQSGIETTAQQVTPKPLDQVKLLPPNPAPTHLFAAPANYQGHRDEWSKQGFDLTPDTDSSKRPYSAEALGFFMKATGSISGPQDPIELPIKDYPTRRFDHEAEMAFVIGRHARAVSPEQAIDYIFGYTIIIDVTLRGSAAAAEERVQRKSFATFSPMGPCIATADEVGDWRNLTWKLWWNGEKRHDAHAADMTVDIPNLLSRASHVLPLRPGDIYTTGSPAGIGQIAPGDTLVVESPQIGKMTLAVVERKW